MGQPGTSLKVLTQD